MELKLFPWQNNKKPFWVNPDNGLEWYIDVETTKWCTRKTAGNLKKLEAVCFYVVEVNGGKRNPITRVLIDKKTNNILAEDTSLEGMACKIDAIRFVHSS